MLLRTHTLHYEVADFDNVKLQQSEKNIPELKLFNEESVCGVRHIDMRLPQALRREWTLLYFSKVPAFARSVCIIQPAICSSSLDSDLQLFMSFLVPADRVTSAHP